MQAKVKKWFGLIFVLSSTIALLMILEIVFRVFGLGYTTTFFQKESHGGMEYLSINKAYMAQYFSQLNVTIPACDQYYFPAQKRDNVFRIYVLGESTSQGFPYGKTESFPFQIEQILNKINIGKKIELVNYSMSAINSHIGLALAKEVIKYPPDLVLIYFGHNEFIGVGGAGEFHSLSFQLNKNLSVFRVYQVAKGLITSLAKKPRNDLMQAMAQKQKIPYDSAVYRKTLVDFESNYRAITTLFKNSRIPVIACGVAANIKDFPPICSFDLRGSSRFNDIRNQLEKKLYTNIQTDVSKLVGGHALDSYLTGRYLIEKNDMVNGRYFLEKARDFDTIRFRASQDINRIILKVTQETGSTYFDTQTLVDQMNSEGIAGSSELLEHVHPEVRTATQIATGISKHICSSIFNLTNSKIPAVPLIATLVEKEASAGKLWRLYNSYPYKDILYFNPIALNSIYEFKVATNGMNLNITPSVRKDINPEVLAAIKNALQQNQALDTVHVKVGFWYYRDKKDFTNAYSEFLIGYIINPFNIQAANNLAVCQLMFGDRKKGEELLTSLYQRKFKDSFIYQNLMIIYKNTGQADKALFMKKKLQERGMDPNVMFNLALVE